MTEGYRLILASDVSDRDGIGLELYDVSGALVAEIFRDDESGERTFNSPAGACVPLPVLEWFLSRASELL